MGNKETFSSNRQIIINGHENGKLYNNVFNRIVVPNSRIATERISRKNFKIEVINERCIYIKTKNANIDKIKIEYYVGNTLYKETIRILKCSEIPEPNLFICNSPTPPEASPCPKKYSIGSLYIEPPIVPEKNTSLLNYKVHSFRAKLFHNNECIDSIYQKEFYSVSDTANNFAYLFFNKARIGDSLEYYNLTIEDAFGKQYFIRNARIKIDNYMNLEYGKEN